MYIQVYGIYVVMSVVCSLIYIFQFFHQKFIQDKSIYIYMSMKHYDEGPPIVYIYIYPATTKPIPLDIFCHIYILRPGTSE